MTIRYGAKQDSSTTPKGGSVRKLRRGKADQNRREDQDHQRGRELRRGRAPDRPRRAFAAEERTLTAPVPGAEGHDDQHDGELGDQRVSVRRRPQRGENL